MNSVSVPTIFLVDDEPIIIDVTSEILTNYNYHCISAGNGRDAISVYKEQWQSIDLIILDIMMPDINGCKVFEEMKLINPNVKCIVMTGYCSDVMKQKMTDCGCHFISKPCDYSELNYLIQSVLYGSSI